MIRVNSPLKYESIYITLNKLHLLFHYLFHLDIRLGGVVVGVLVTEPKCRGFKPDLGCGFLRAIKIRNTPCFGWEVKPEVPCRKILRHIKIPLRYFRY
jgi:hypothetical protein